MSNTVGSQGKIVLKSGNGQSLRVTKTQWKILLGGILGDAYVTKRGKIQIEQSSSQKEYLFWKYDQLESISYGEPSRVVREDKRYDKKYTSYRFWTRQFFRDWRKKFYPEGKKIIPEDLTSLYPLSLAVWYMDDGYLRKEDSIAISTDGFIQEDIESLQKILKEQYDLKPSVVKSGKIYFGKKDSKKLCQIISPFIISSMEYKIPWPRND